MKFMRDVVGGGFAFGGWTGGEDDLVDLGEVTGASQQVGNTELLRSDTIHRRERSVEDVIDTVVVARPLDGSDVGWLLEYADQALIACRICAVVAGIDVGDVVADGAEAKVSLELLDGMSESASVFIAATEDVKRQALRGLGADTGELAKLFDQA